MTQLDFDSAFAGDDVTHPEDCERIKAVGAIRGLSMSLRQASEIWEWNSSRMCAQWLGLPKHDEEIWLVIEDFVQDRTSGSK